MAILISFLFSIFAAFQQRERFVVTIGARAGVPPSGLGLLLAHAAVEPQPFIRQERAYLS